MKYFTSHGENTYVHRFWKDKWELRRLGGMEELIQQGIGGEVRSRLSGVFSQWISHWQSLLTQVARPTPRAPNSAGLDGAWEGVFLTSSQVKLMLPMGDHILRTTAPGSPFHVHKVKKWPREGKDLAPNLTIVVCCIAAGVRTHFSVASPVLLPGGYSWTDQRWGSPFLTVCRECEEPDWPALPDCCL